MEREFRKGESIWGRYFWGIWGVDYEKVVKILGRVFELRVSGGFKILREGDLEF